MKRVHTLLIDMDCILVDMLPAWLERYNKLSREKVLVKDIEEYEVRKFIQKPGLLDDALHEKGFFRNLSPMPGATKYFQKLLDDGYDVVIVTQPPRKADYAIKEKRDWIKEYFPEYDLSNMVFCHRKNLIRGDLLFDDKPGHLLEWKAMNPKGLICTIQYPYNKEAQVDARFEDKRSGWREFYEFVKKIG
jgi:5'(3')-deoxyribonucleotidase